MIWAHFLKLKHLKNINRLFVDLAQSSLQTEEHCWIDQSNNDPVIHALIGCWSEVWATARKKKAHCNLSSVNLRWPFPLYEYSGQLGYQSSAMERQKVIYAKPPNTQDK